MKDSFSMNFDKGVEFIFITLGIFIVENGKVMYFMARDTIFFIQEKGINIILESIRYYG
jgi:hypothetical protein